jgi:hypothetical protein
MLDAPPAAEPEGVGEAGLLDGDEVDLTLAQRISAPRALELGEDVEDEAVRIFQDGLLSLSRTYLP